MNISLFFFFVFLSSPLFARQFPHLAQPALRIFPNFPSHGARRHLGSTATERLVRKEEERSEKEKEARWAQSGNPSSQG